MSNTFPNSTYQLGNKLLLYNVSGFFFFFFNVCMGFAYFKGLDNVIKQAIGSFFWGGKSSFALSYTHIFASRCFIKFFTGTSLLTLTDFISWSLVLELFSSHVDAMILCMGRTATSYTSSSKPLPFSLLDSAVSAP